MKSEDLSGDVFLDRAIVNTRAQLQALYDLVTHPLRDEGRWPDSVEESILWPKKVNPKETREEIYFYLNQILSGQIVCDPSIKLSVKEIGYILSVLVLACKFLIHAIRLRKMGSKAGAWQAVADASLCFGYIHGRNSIEGKASISIKANSIKHKEMAAAKKYILNAWEREAGEYGFNKSLFARTYVKLVANNFSAKNGDPLVVTETTIARDWLPKGSRPSIGR